MALSRAAGLCRLALRTQWTCVRLVSSVAGEGKPPSGEEKPGRLVDLEALRRERALRLPAERQQHAPPRKTRRSYTPTYQQLQVNRDIGACKSVEAVLDLVRLNLAVLNEVNVATALMTISRRVGEHEAAHRLGGDARFAQLLEATALLFARMAPQELSNALYACGQLGITPPDEWLQRFWDASASKLDGFVPQGLSNVIYACGQLGVAPPAAWMQRYWEISASLLGAFISQDFSNTLYACGQLGITPPADWLQRYWHVSASRLREFSEQSLSNTMYACGELGIVPPADWMQLFWYTSGPMLDGFYQQGLSNTLYASGQLGITPPASWLQRFWQVSATKLGFFVPQGLSNMVYASGQLGITPSTVWMQHYWQASASKLGEFNEQDFANTMYSCGQLGITPPGDWLERYWHFSSLKLDTFSPQGLSNALLACAHLDIRPPASWLRRFSDSFEQSLTRAGCQDLANTALSLATLALWELPLWSSLWEQLCQAFARDSSSWYEGSNLIARQLYQAYQVAAKERPGMLPAMDPEMFASTRQSWLYGSAETTSRLHADVSACLTCMGVVHANERWCERAERKVDIAVEGSAAPVAFEVDGPYHFLQDGRPNGSTLLRNRMLAAHGWRVAVVDYRVWGELSTQAQREEYLRRLLA